MKAPVKMVLDAHQLGHAGVARAGKDLVGRAGLQGLTGVDDHHPVGQATGFLQVVRDQQHRHRHLLAPGGEFAVQALARGRVHRRERLVEQQHTPRTGRPLVRGRHHAHQSPRQRHPLLLPARELGRPALQELAQTHPRQQRTDGVWRPVGAGGQRHIGLDVHVRKQRVVLEHQAHAALLRRKANTLRGVQPDLVAAGNAALQAVWRPQAGHGAQHAGLAAARRPDQRHQLAGAAVEFGGHPDRAGGMELDLQTCGHLQRSCRARPRTPTRSKASTTASASTDTATSASASTWADCSSSPCTLS